MLKLKKILNIPHYEALDVVAKISGLSKWEQVGQLTEQESRRGIYLEQEKKKYAKDKTYEELIKQEYQRFIKNGN